jgi:uncharacterized protein YcgI (DUF1989 family)
MPKDLHLIPAGTSAAAPLRSGHRLIVVNTHGAQVVDCWAFADPDTSEFMSMEHSRVEMGKLTPGTGDSLFTNRRRPILTVLEDTSPRVHDTTLAACDVYRYQRLGYDGHHANCTDNLRNTMRNSGFTLHAVPCPLNLWENARVAVDGSQQIEPPVSKPGDRVVVRAEIALLVVLSACPQDMAPTNGADATPADVHFAVGVPG